LCHIFILFVRLDQLKGLCADLWIAGQETTSTTLTWGMNYLIWNPAIQAKVHAELDEVINGTDIVVTTANRPAMPYTNAVINVRGVKGNKLAAFGLHTASKIGPLYLAWSI
jgi:hypothetical protein